jgi:hypothetical protein
MICPKCGFEQPDSAECMRCGIVIGRYKGPLLGAAAPRPPVTSPAPSPATEKELAMAAAGGRPYGGPLPATVAGGTIHGGTLYGAPPPGAAAPTFGATRAAFRGTFGVGKILGESFSIYFRNFIPFVILTALALSPLYLLQAYTTAAPAAGATSPMAALSALLLIPVSLLCPYIATAAIVYGVFQQMRGGDTSIGECLARGLTSFLPILFLAIIQSIAISLGMILCLVPGILLALRWAVSIPAAVEERPGASGAMSRSTYLTEGYRGEIFGILFVIGIMSIGSQLVAALVALKDPSLFLVLSGVANLFNTGLSATSTAVMYYRLRSIKESIDVDQIASVFA